MRARQSYYLWPLLALAGLFVGLPSSAERVGNTIPGPVPARIIRVVDGDTVVVRARIWLDQEVETKVRLQGIDTPELRGKCQDESLLALAARDFVIGLGKTVNGTTNDEVQLFDIEYGKFAGRVVARIKSPNGVDYSHALIAAGFARSYDGGRRQPWC